MSKMRKEAATPVAVAVPDHVPVKNIAPAIAGANGGKGNNMVHKSPLGSGAAQLTGSPPL